MLTFRTHTGEIVTGERLTAALASVANAWADNARAIRREDHYASHVTEATKDNALAEGLAFAEQIRRGETTGFTTWQRINTALTGECVALLAKTA
jgi:hypothetical protein